MTAAAFASVVLVVETLEALMTVEWMIELPW
jgi:hypothetical protein